MTSIQVDILDPKAKELLKELEDLKLIAIKKSSKSGFIDVVNRLRKKAKKVHFSNQIIKEVELVRAKRYGS